MNIPFSKYHGTGNDFIIVDNRAQHLPHHAPKFYHQLCDRRFGIGADGIIFIENHPDASIDFEMIYFNADGSLGSMCGNGGRCIVAFAKKLGILSSNHTHFMAVDGLHEAKINDAANYVELKMQDVKAVQQTSEKAWVLDTGSPHYIQFVKDIDTIKVYEEGYQIRYSPPYKAQGINVNFVAPNKQGLSVATYERGVEAETFSCGTGVVASGIAAIMAGYACKNKDGDIPIVTKGGALKVAFKQNLNAASFNNIWLKGPAVHVFNGTFNYSKE